MTKNKKIVLWSCVAIFIVFLLLIGYVLFCLCYLNPRLYEEKENKYTRNNTINKKIISTQKERGVTAKKIKHVNKKANNTIANRTNIYNQIQSFKDDVNLAMMNKEEYENSVKGNEINVILNTAPQNWSAQDWETLKKYLMSFENVEESLIKKVCKCIGKLYSRKINKDVVLECVNKWLKLIPNVDRNLGNEILYNIIPIQSRINCHKDALKGADLLLQRTQGNSLKNMNYRAEAISYQSTEYAWLGNFDKSDKILNDWLKTTKNATTEQRFGIMFVRLINCMLPNASQTVRKKIPEFRDAILKDQEFTENQKKQVRMFQ